MKNNYRHSFDSFLFSGLLRFGVLLALLISFAAMPLQAQITATLKPTESTCQANGIISVSSVSGGVAPYQVAIISGPGAVIPAPYYDLNASGVYSFSGVRAGTFTVSIIDDLGNERQLTTTVPGSYSISNYTPVPSLNTCVNGTQTGKITVSTITAGLAPFRYRLTKPTTTTFTAISGTSFVVNNLIPGTTYELQVWDACDNFQTRQVQIPAIANPTVPAPTIRYLDCSGNVQATFAASGGTGPYTYSVTSGPNQVGTSNTTGVFSFTTGTYNVRVTDQCGGVTNRSVTIGASPAFNMSVSGAASASCSSGTAMTGAIAIAVSGGISPYQSVVLKGCSGQTITLQPDANGSYNQTLQNLTRPCMYTAVATDACGTVRTQMFDMAAPGGSTVLGQQNSISCPSSGSVNYRFTMEATLGPPYSPTPPYTFSLSTSGGTPVTGFPLTSSNRTQTVSLAPGVYTYRIADACGTLSQVVSVTIGTYTPPTVSLIASNQCINAGQVNLTGTNNNPLNPTFKQYKILSGPNRAGETNTSGVFSNLTSGGAYVFEFSDGCKTVTTAITVPPYQQPSFEVGFGALCPPVSGSSTASLQAFDLNPSTIVRPYTYQIIATGTTGGQTRPAQLDSLFTNLTAGFYNIQGFDACNNSFAFVGQVGVMPTPAIQASRGPYCVGQLFRLRVTKPVFGATYTYFLNGQQVLSTTAVVAQIPAQSGNYSVLVTAPGGCTAISDASFTVILTGKLTINGPVTACAGATADLTAAAVTAGSGSGTFSYFQNAATSIPLDATTGPANAITKAGTYYIKLTATISCSNSAPVTVSFAPAFTATLSGATICTGQSVTLTATGGNTYNFGSGAGAASTRVVAPTVTTTYSVTAFSSQGCPAIASNTVTVNSLPVATLSSLTICRGESATLTAADGAGLPGSVYNFGSGNSAINTRVVSPTATTTYSVTVTNENGCTRAVSGTVTVNPLPIPAFSSATICAGQSVTLTATGGTLYNFGSGNTPTGKLVVDPTVTTVYGVTVISDKGCTAPASGTVMVNSLPSAALSNATICTGNSATLTASGGILYNFGSGNTATSTRVVSPTVNTTYSVTVTNANGCSAVGSGTVSVNSLPTPGLSSATVCNGESVTLTATGGALYNFGSGNQFVGTLVVRPTATTTYTVLVTNAEGCTAIGSGTVTVNALPAAALSNATICTGNTATLTASGGAGLPGALYDFGNGSQATNTLIINPTATTAYTVLVTSGAGCTAQATGIVTVNALPIATLSSSTICRGESATLTATDGSGQPGTLYNFGSGNTATGTLIVSPTATTTYTVLVTNAEGCTAAVSGMVTVNPLPTATLTGATICTGQTTTLTAGGGGTGGPFSYTLLNTSEVNTTGRFAVSPTASTNYTVVVSNGAGCRATATNVVVVNALPVATLLSSGSAICDGQSTTLTASGGGAGGPFQYEFSGNINNTTGVLIVSPSATTTYSVVVTNAQNCTASASTALTVYPVPVLDIVPDNQVVCLGNSTTLTVTNCPGTLRWSTGETTASITITPIINTTYTVTCTTPEGCTTSARSEVVVSIPGSVSVTDNAPLCAGAALELAASGSGSVYRWSGPNGFTANTATVSVSNVTPANAGVYSVTISGGLCAGVGSTTVTLNPAVTASLSSASICEGESVTLVASGGGVGTGPFTYEFTGNVNNTTGRFVVSPSATTSYSVLITNAQNCMAVATGTVTLHPAVTANFSSSTICRGGSATLTASGGSGQPGSGQPGSGQPGTLYNFGSGNTTSTQIIVNPTVTTVYSVTVTNAQGCTGLATATVTVNPLPEPTLSSATICAGGTVRLTANGGSVGGPFSYTFSDGTINTTGTLSVTPATTTNYSVLVSSSAGCLASATGTVTVNPLPVGSLSSATICVGESATLIASGGEFFDFASGVSPNNILVVEPTVTTTYTVLITNGNRCSVAVSGTVTVNPVPEPTLSSATICAGGSATLTATGGSSGGAFSYTLLQTNEVNTTGKFVVSPTATTTYEVLVANNRGCTASASSEVTVNTLPTASLSGGTICVGESATLTASGGSGQPGAGLSGTLYNFGSGNTPDGVLIVNPTTTTTYTVIVTDRNGCRASTTNTVVVNSLPVVLFSSATICAGGSATLLASGIGNQGGLLYDFGSGNQLSGVLIVEPTSTSTYSVVITNANTCTALANGTVTVNPLPTVGITSVVCNGLLTYTVNFTATTGASVTANVGSVVGNQVVGILTGQAVTLTATLAGCIATTQTTEDCARNAASLGNFVWLDLNADGQQDAGEPGLSGVVVTLVQNGSAIATTTTDANGLYSFTNLTPGIPYSVSFSTPTGYTATLANTGNDATDSDPVGGITAPVTLTNGENNPTLDAGFNALYDVGIAKTVLSSGPYYPGSGLITYQLTLTNNSIQPVYNVQVQDQLPAGISFVSGAGFVTTGTNAVSAVVAGPLAALGGTASLTLTVSVASNYTAISVVNNAAVTRFTATTDAAGPAPADTNPANNTASVTVPISPLASLGNFVFSDTDRDGVQDTDESGIDNITVILYINGVASATTTTTAGGLYSFTGLTPGESLLYSVGFSTPLNFSASPDNEGGEDALDSDAIGGLTGPVSLTAGENNTTLDAGFYPLRFDLALAKSVVSAPNPLLPGSLIRYALVLSNQGEITATNTVVTDTPPAGLSFSAANSPGFVSSGSSQSILVASLSPGQSATLSIAYTLAISTSMAVGNRAEITADSGEDLDSGPGNAPIDPDEDDSAEATIQPVEFAALGNFVWEDTNANGQQDSGEPGMENVAVSLVQNGSVIATTTTDAGGFYSFTGLVPGVSYQVQFGSPTGFTATVSNTGADGTDSDRDPITGLSQSVTMAGGETNNTLDAGFYRPATLGDQVFIDTDRDGIQTNGEPGLGGVIVTLISNGVVVATTLTNPDGTYSFTGLTPGVPYSVSFTTPAGYEPITFPTGVSGSVTLASGETDNTLDAGFAEPLRPILNLDKVVSTAKARLGEVISYTVLLSNTGTAPAMSIVVSDTLGEGLSMVPGSVSVSAGIFTPGSAGGNWVIDGLPVNTTVTLTYSASITEEGVLYNTASIPGDEARVCTSVPFRVCPGSDYAIQLDAPAGSTRYQWLYTAPGSATAVVVADGTLNSYTATQAGEYSLLADDGLTGLCAQPSCCPVFIEEVFIPEFVLRVRQPTCVGNQPQPNGQLTLTDLGVDAGAIYDYQYSAGSSFTALSAVPTSATAVPADGVIATGLGDGTYTVRITERQTGCFRDVTTVPLAANCTCPEEICVPVIIRKTRSLVK